jgi:hypothetical protein
MNYQILRPVRLIAVFLMMTGLSVGCATVVVPLSPTDITMTDADTDHGWLLGTIHLTRHESDHTEKFTKMRMVDMKWWLEEETTGKRFHISPLPIDGPFAVKLPAGSYRVTGIGFSNMRGGLAHGASCRVSGPVPRVHLPRDMGVADANRILQWMDHARGVR